MSYSESIFALGHEEWNWSRQVEHFQDLKDAGWPFILVTSDPDWPSQILDDEGSTAMAFEAALARLPLLNEQAVTWDQLEHFVSDSESVRHYRDLVLWLRTGLGASSLRHAEDLIAQRIDSYAIALKKHGLDTVVGTLRVLISKDALVKDVATGIAVGAFAEPLYGVLTGAGLAVADVLAHLAERKIAKLDAARGQYSEVAYIYEAQRRFTEA